eukprot:NODE_697_length_1220_cov_290.416738_g503_i0.p1 GENE.NODE_697_length_1220_cov_290.416738_g503_i0~~NODE_697_length_1220_cov_290.416738_g503_i0.p1  ORF type:complete len:354 (-),score=153.64 NODE_697_length_1220_cov_290.416738_g503_i0:159-1187(-)
MGGFHGRDVDSIVEDLYKAAVQMLKTKIREKNKDAVKQKARQVVLRALCGDSNMKEDFEPYLDDGALLDQEVTLDVPQKPPQGKGEMGQEDIQSFMSQLQAGLQKSKPTKMKVSEALKVQEEIEMDKLLDTEMVAAQALKATEEDGIVVLDEIDKICQPSDYTGRKYGVSGEGVQQDLLPLVEGTTVTTKSGVSIKTDHILFIASGAFSAVKPSDMIAELQGRLPLRVELQALIAKQDFYRILTEPKTNLIYQNMELLRTEDVTLEFEDEAIRVMAEMAYQANATVQNIGARRLITVIEKILEEIGFNAPDMSGEKVVITAAMVREQVESMLKTQDLSKFII